VVVVEVGVVVFVVQAQVILAHLLSKRLAVQVVVVQVVDQRQQLE
jgi:hypothetical protein